MSLMSNIENLKLQASQDYLQKFWSSKIPIYTPDDGGFFFDNDSSKAYYNFRQNKLPNLMEMWSSYRKGAESRGLKADYLTFKNFYDQVKTAQNTQFLSHLQNAEVKGISLDKIHDVLRENPDLKQDLINATADGSDISNQYRAQYFPPKQKTIGGVIADNPLLIPGAATAGAFAYDYATGVPGQADYDADLKKSSKIKRDANKKFKTFVKDNEPINPKTKKPYKSGSKTYDKFLASDKYKEAVDNRNASLKAAKDLKPTTAPQARYKNLVSKFGKKPSFGGNILAASAPTLVQEGAKALGVKDADAEFVGDLTAGGVGAGMLANLARMYAAGSAGGPAGIAGTTLLALMMLARPASKMMGLGSKEEPTMEPKDYLEAGFR